MNSSDASDYDSCEGSTNNADDSVRKSSDYSSSSEYSESSIIGSDSEFGPEGTQPIPNEGDNESVSNPSKKLPLAWVPTFKERLGDVMGRLLNDSLKICVSGKMNAPPIISISLLKVQKHISFPLYEDSLDSIIPAFEQSVLGRGTETDVDPSFRNSWELGHSDFEILNTEWNSYLMDVVQPLIQRDLRIDVGFRLSLYKLLLFTSGSFFKPHRDSEKDNGRFGTVVVQLPSFYDSGKLIVRHNDRTEEIDLSSTTPQNAFSIFYTAFYCDCEHEVLQITKGVRACLVYDLVLMEEIQPEMFPSAERLELEGREVDLVNLLHRSWPSEQKIIYCLSQKYTQKNLSLANLKSSDRLIGQFFQKYADSCGLEVMIGILKRKKYRYAKAIYKPRKVAARPRREPNHMYWYNIENGYEFLNWNYYNDDDDYDDIATISDVDSNDPNVDFYERYKIKYLKSLRKGNRMKLPSLDVHFESEVLPENSFHDIKAFHESQDLTENDGGGVECSKFYQCAAIMVFRPDDLLPVLVEGDAKLSKIEETFLSEFKRHNIIGDDTVKGKCLKWCHVLLDRFLSPFFTDKLMKNLSEIFEILFLMDDIELLRKFLKTQPFEQGNFAYLHRICQKHGWSTFSVEILSKFGKLKPEQRIVNLQKFIDYGENAAEHDADKQTIVHNILKEMLKKFDSCRESGQRYGHRPLKKDQQEDKRDKTRKFLISLWPLANKVNFVDLAEYAKTLPMDIVVPALISIGQNKENISHHLWMDVAKHFQSTMERFLQLPLDSTFTWKQNVTLSCHCKHCTFVEEFLQRSYQQKLDFFGKRPVREHVQRTLTGLDNVRFWTLASGTLRINKPRKTGEIQSDQHNFVTAHLPKLSSLMIASAI